MSGFSFGTPQAPANTGATFGTPQTSVAGTGFAFGASNTPQAPAQQPAASFGQQPATSFGQQPAASFGFGTPATATPSLLSAPAATTAPGGISFGMSAPPYGAQTTTSAAPSLSFGLGTAATRYDFIP